MGVLELKNQMIKRFSTMKYRETLYFILCMAILFITFLGCMNYRRLYYFRVLVGPEIWTYLKDTIAVDCIDRVYVTNGSTIYRIVNGSPSTYLSANDILLALGEINIDANDLEITSIDVGPDGRVYILEGRSDKILVSESFGSVEVHRDISDIHGFPVLIGVVNQDFILLINLYDGLWKITPNGNTLLYDDNLVLGGTNCGSEDFAVSYDGFFCYLPGCLRSPIIGGRSDGSGAGILAEVNDINQNNSWWGFGGVGRDLRGGFIVNFEGIILHFKKNGHWKIIETIPTLENLGRQMEDNPFMFSSRPIAVGPTGRIYIASQSTIYVAE